jgi:hypothetical protein
MLETPRSSARKTPRCESRPLKGSGPKFFDNSKAGKFTPITWKRLRSPWGLRVWITYKFCSSMLSSAVDYKASSVKHLRIVASIA